MTSDRLGRSSEGIVVALLGLCEALTLKGRARPSNRGRTEPAERMGTTQSVISRLEEGGGARNRLDTLARGATALDRHLIVSFPEKVPAKLKDAVQVA